MPFVTSSTKKKGKMEPATEVEVGLFLFLFFGTAVNLAL